MIDYTFFFRIFKFSDDINIFFDIYINFFNNNLLIFFYGHEYLE